MPPPDIPFFGDFEYPPDHHPPDFDFAPGKPPFDDFDLASLPRIINRLMVRFTFMPTIVLPFGCPVHWNVSESNIRMLVGVHSAQPASKTFAHELASVSPMAP